MSNDIKLSISIVHHDGLDMLRTCLKSIEKNAPAFPFELVVVDNVSTDGAVAMMRTEFPAIKIVLNQERHGFGFNQNTGMRACQGEYVLLLNDDTIVHENALNELCKYLDEHPRVGIVGPRLLNPDGSLQLSCYKFPSPMRYIWENSLLTAAFPNSTICGDYRRWNHDSDRSVDFIIGAAMLVRRHAIDEAGLFDTSFFMYFEEIDWQMRIRSNGWDVRLWPSARITHLGGQSTENAKDKQFVEFNISSIKLIAKHYGSFGNAVQRAAMIFGAAVRLAMWSAIPLVRSDKKAEAEAQKEKWQRLLYWWCGYGPFERLAPSSYWQERF